MGGLFGVISNKKCRRDLFYGTDYHSHLGSKRAGLAVYNGDDRFARDIHSIESSYFRLKFEEDILKYEGNLGIGVISDSDAQPMLLNSHLGRFAIATVGKICNRDILAEEVLSGNRNFTEMSSGKVNSTELIAQMITCKSSFKEGIEYVQQKIKGSCSFLILTEYSIIACRDLYGRTPLIIGKKDCLNEDGEREEAQAVTSETCCFPNLQYEESYILGPGEAVEIGTRSIQRIVEPKQKMQICSFLWVYYGYPPSSYENINVDQVRYNLGYNMAKEETEKIDTVCSIPDSGTGMAVGYSEGMKVPYRCAYVKYTPTWSRSFTPSTQEFRNLVAKMKLIPNRHILQNKTLVFCDDSIVRGTQLKNNVRNIKDFGAKDIHIRISCPPILYPCPFINFSQSRTPLELVTRRFIQEKEGAHDRNIGKYSDHNSPEYQEMIESMRQKLNVSSLKFCTIENLVKAIGLPKERICTHCFDGTSYGHE